jgi:hypothetical protein
VERARMSALMTVRCARAWEVRMCGKKVADGCLAGETLGKMAGKPTKPPQTSRENAVRTPGR